MLKVGEVSQAAHDQQMTAACAELEELVHKLDPSSSQPPNLLGPLLLRRVTGTLDPSCPADSIADAW